MKKWNNLKRNITTENILKYKKANALFRLTLKQDKKQSINNFTSQISPETPQKKILSNIRRFCWLNPKKSIHCIFNPTTNQNTTHKLEIADFFCKNFSEISSDTNFTTTFIHQKQTSLNNTHTVIHSQQKSNRNREAHNINRILSSTKHTKRKHTRTGQNWLYNDKNIDKTTKNRIITCKTQY